MRLTTDPLKNSILNTFCIFTLVLFVGASSVWGYPTSVDTRTPTRYLKGEHVSEFAILQNAFNFDMDLQEMMDVAMNAGLGLICTKTTKTDVMCKKTVKILENSNYWDQFDVWVMLSPDLIFFHCAIWDICGINREYQVIDFINDGIMPIPVTEKSTTNNFRDLRYCSRRSHDVFCVQYVSYDYRSACSRTTNRCKKTTFISPTTFIARR